MGSYGHNHKSVVGLLVLCLVVTGLFGDEVKAADSTQASSPESQGKQANDATCLQPCLSKCMNQPTQGIRSASSCSDACHGQCG